MEMVRKEYLTKVVNLRLMPITKGQTTNKYQQHIIEN